MIKADDCVCSGMGVAADVHSPTFTLMNIYEGKLPLYHFDLYRIKSWHELLDIGYEDYFYSGKYCMIEWPEKIEDLLPPGTVNVTIHVLDDESREITINI